MAGVFPIAKLGYLALRQVSKPIANLMKAQAKRSAFFREKICIPPAQLYHYWETVIKLRMIGIGKPDNVKPLNVDVAVELGADMLGEVVIFSLGAFALFLEYRRQSNNTAHREHTQCQRIVDLEQRVINLQTRIEQLELDSRSKANASILQRFIPSALKSAQSSSPSAYLGSEHHEDTQSQHDIEPSGRADSRTNSQTLKSQHLHSSDSPAYSEQQIDSPQQTDFRSSQQEDAEQEGPSPRQKLIYKLIKLVVDRDDD